jgi:thioredoxin 1
MFKYKWISFTAVFFLVLALTAGCQKNGVEKKDQTTAPVTDKPEADVPPEGGTEELPGHVEGSGKEPEVKATAEPVSVLTADEFKKALASNRIVLVDFYADWCGPCRMIKPIIKELASDYAGKITVAKVDTDKARELAVAQGVTGIPDVRLYVDGKLKEKFIGARSRSEYMNAIDNALKE